MFKMGSSENAAGDAGAAGQRSKDKDIVARFWYLYAGVCTAFALLMRRPLKKRYKLANSIRPR